MTSVAMTRHKADNYTPASLLLSYAKTHPGFGYRYDPRSGVYLRHEDKLYRYHHWKIEPLNRTEETVTVYLEEVEKGDLP